MSGEDSLLGQADQLMRRHRSFVAGAGSSGPAEDGDADLPLLTEVVTAGASAELDGALRLRLEEMLGLQREAMLREFERWLDEQLPQVVTGALDGFTDRLLGLITRRARAELLPRLEAIAARAGGQSEQSAEEQAMPGEGEQPV